MTGILGGHQYDITKWSKTQKKAVSLDSIGDDIEFVQPPPPFSLFSFSLS
jgi:hypothetical protein